MRGLVYLAGPITGGNWVKVTDWRKGVERALADCGIGALSPMRGKEYLEGESAIADVYTAHQLSTQRAIVERDRFDVKRCDLVIANFSEAGQVSIGSCVEYGWADAYGKPIIAVFPQHAPHPHDHAFLRELSAHIVDTLPAAIGIAVQYLIPEDALLARQTLREGLRAAVREGSPSTRYSSIQGRGKPGFEEGQAPAGSVSQSMSGTITGSKQSVTIS